MKHTGRRLTTPEPAAVAASLDLCVVGGRVYLPVPFKDTHSMRLVMHTGATTTTLTRASFDLMNRTGTCFAADPQVFDTANERRQRRGLPSRKASSSGRMK